MNTVLKNVKSFSLEMLFLSSYVKQKRNLEYFVKIFENGFLKHYAAH